MSVNINIYGCGNMTQAIFQGLKGKPIDLQVWTYTPSFIRAQNLATVLGGTACREIADMPRSKYIFLGCKPQQFESLAESLKGNIEKDAIVISIMAGLTVDKIKKSLGLENVIRVMPSTPSLVNKGISLFYADAGTPTEDLEVVSNIFKGVSKVIKTKSEDEFDLISTISGCGPAYVFEFARIFSQYLVDHKVNQGTADLIANELLLGSSKLMDESHESFEELRNKVTSKGGMTFEALEEFKKRGLEDTLRSGFLNAYKRAKELNKLL